MPTKDNYFEFVFRRENKIKKSLLEFFFSISSYPRMLLEVFTRKCFGERYFSILSVVIAGLLMFYLPFALTGNFDLSLPEHYRHSEKTFWEKYATWYIYTIAFLLFAGRHLDEIKKYGSIMKHQRFSLSTGFVNPLFEKFTSLFPNPLVKVFLEAFPFFIGGVILWNYGQPIGMMLMVSAVIYFFSYVYAYEKGRDFVMDKLDEMLFNEELEKAFVQDLGPDKTRGVNVFSEKPSSEEMRDKTYRSMAGADETAEVL